jgi:outer membrane protein OmpA-like peptidoglycan-associated protein
VSPPATPPDADQDGIPDAADKAPAEAEDKDGYADEDGAPDPDNDSDAVLDGDDLCPLAAPAPGAPAVSGCPDEDKDGFVKDYDACPTAAPGADQVASLSRGCPPNAGPTPGVWAKDVELLSGAHQTVVVLPGPVSFRADDTLDPASEPALRALVAWLDANPRALRVEVAVHTDNAEIPEADRLRRTQARADAVRAWLVTAPPATPGVPPTRVPVEAGRVTAVGYGLDQPLADNRTPANRTLNRRVEVRVLEVRAPRRGER